MKLKLGWKTTLAAGLITAFAAERGLDMVNVEATDVVRKVEWVFDGKDHSGGENSEQLAEVAAQIRAEVEQEVAAQIQTLQSENIALRENAQTAQQHAAQWQTYGESMAARNQALQQELTAIPPSTTNPNGRSQIATNDGWESSTPSGQKPLRSSMPIMDTNQTSSPDSAYIKDSRLYTGGDLAMR